jgi:hypothetical protein
VSRPLPVPSPIRDAIRAVAIRLGDASHAVVGASAPLWSPEWLQLVAAMAAGATVVVGSSAMGEVRITADGQIREHLCDKATARFVEL